MLLKIPEYMAATSPPQYCSSPVPLAVGWYSHRLYYDHPDLNPQWDSCVFLMIPFDPAPPGCGLLPQQGVIMNRSHNVIFWMLFRLHLS